MRFSLGILCVGCGLVWGCAPATESPDAHQETELNVVSDVKARLARFAPTRLEADLSGVPDGERAVLDELVEAGRLMDEVFLHQVWVGNRELREKVRNLNDAALVDYFNLNFGPWDRLDGMEPYLGEGEHPPGAGYYPVDMTAKELEEWIEAHPEDGDALKSLFTVVRRQGDALVAIPYSQEYREWLEPAAERLRKAAALTQNESLRLFLEARADAFLNDDYYASDLLWMDLDSAVEVTIGPYETYEDGLFGYKAAFEAFVTVTLPQESAALERYKAHLPWLEGNLPLAQEHKNLDRGTDSPIRVVDVVFTGGDTKAGVQTLAFNLPNDERVREEKGSKKVLLRNVMRAKYDQILVPIAQRVLTPDQVDEISFQAYFDEVLHHELSHGLGPGKITVGGRETEVRLELKEHSSTLEEAKADVMGIYNILALIAQGEMDAGLRQTLEPTYVAGLFRSARFGVHEAHGQGVVSQFNYLEEQGALEVDDEGRFRIVSEKFPEAIRSLLAEMLLLQATGDHAGTGEFLARYGKPSASLLAAIDRLGDVPVDIRPLYTYAGQGE